MSEPFIGQVQLFGFNFAPRGWAFCDGQLLPISQNTALFSILGTTYGGDGRTTFALPNLRDRFVMGAGNGPGLTNRQLGERVGVDAVTLTEAEMPPHNHALVSATAATSSSPAGATLADAGRYRAYRVGGQQVPAGSTIAPTGGGQAHPNVQPALGLSYCIALVGIFPSRS